MNIFKLVSASALPIAALLFISGCSHQPQVQYFTKDKYETTFVKVNNGIGVPSWAANESTAFKSALQAIAEATISKGYKYFAIYVPKDISNTNGSLINSAKEAIEFCTPNQALIGNLGGAGLHKCGTYNTSAYMTAYMMNEQSEQFTTYTASDVIQYLKDNDMYDTDLKLEVVPYKSK